MAVIAIHKNTKVRMALNAGLDDNNKQITKYKTLDKVRPEIGNEVVFNIAKEIASLQKHPLMNIIKHEEYVLLEEK